MTWDGMQCSQIMCTQASRYCPGQARSDYCAMQCGSHLPAESYGRLAEEVECYSWMTLNTPLVHVKTVCTKSVGIAVFQKHPCIDWLRAESLPYGPTSRLQRPAACHSSVCSYCFCLIPSAFKHWRHCLKCRACLAASDQIRSMG